MSMEHVHDWSLAWRMCEGMYWGIAASRAGYFGEPDTAGLFDDYVASLAMRAQPECGE